MTEGKLQSKLQIADTHLAVHHFLALSHLSSVVCVCYLLSLLNAPWFLFSPQKDPDVLFVGCLYCECQVSCCSFNPLSYMPAWHIGTKLIINHHKGQTTFQHVQVATQSMNRLQLLYWMQESNWKRKWNLGKLCKITLSKDCITGIGGLFHNLHVQWCLLFSYFNIPLTCLTCYWCLPPKPKVPLHA